MEFQWFYENFTKLYIFWNPRNILWWEIERAKPAENMRLDYLRKSFETDFWVRNLFSRTVLRKTTTKPLNPKNSSKTSKFSQNPGIVEKILEISWILTNFRIFWNPRNILRWRVERAKPAKSMRLDYPRKMFETDFLVRNLFFRKARRKNSRKP